MPAGHRKEFSLWKWLSTRIGCLEKLWHLCLQIFLVKAWYDFQSYLCFGQKEEEGRPQGPFQSRSFHGSLHGLVPAFLRWADCQKCVRLLGSWAATNNSCFYHHGVRNSSTLTIFEALGSYPLSEIHVAVCCWFVSTSHSFCFPIRCSLLGKQEQHKTHWGRAVNPQLTGCCDSGGQVIFVVLITLGQGGLSHGWQCLLLTALSVSWPVLPPRAVQWVVMECDWGGHPSGQPWLCVDSWF